MNPDLSPVGERTIHHALDIISADGVAGWAFAEEGGVRISVLVDGIKIGEAQRSILRPDVNAQNPDVADSLRSGFTFPFTSSHFDHVDSSFAEIVVRFESERELVASDPVQVPVLRSADTPARWPLPPSVARVLQRLRRPGADDKWDEERAIADLGAVVRRGSKREPALYAYLGYLAQVWTHARFVARNFPYINPTHRTAKDAISVQTGSEELLAIAAHLATLQGHRVSGSLLEFGCFKGHSTCVLSFACALLDLQMDAFDSFEGFPESDSDEYVRGEFAGGLDEVKQNVAGLGRLERVRFHKGFFADSLSRWQPDRVALVWMDVDLESSSRDVMQIFDDIPRASAIFSHECWQENFVDGAVVATGFPEAVLRPIIEKYEEASRTPVGRFIAGNTGVIWDRDDGVPVLSPEGLRALRELALEG